MESEAAGVRAREVRQGLEAQLKGLEDECRMLREREVDAKARGDVQTAREVEAELAREQERAIAQERDRELEREREQEREAHEARVGEVQAQMCELEVELRKAKEVLAAEVQTRAQEREAEARQAQQSLLEAARNLEMAQHDVACLTLALHAAEETGQAVQVEGGERYEDTAAVAAEAAGREPVEMGQALGGDALIRPKQGIEAKTVVVGAGGALQTLAPEPRPSSRLRSSLCTLGKEGVAPVLVAGVRRWSGQGCCWRRAWTCRKGCAECVPNSAIFWRRLRRRRSRHRTTSRR